MCNRDMQKKKSFKIEHTTAETVESLKIAGERQLPPPSQVPPFRMDRASSKTK